MIRILLSLIGSPVRADAAVGSGPGVSEMWQTICTTLPYCNLGTAAPAFFSQRIVSFVFPLIVAAAVCVVIYAGIKMITGGEDGYTEAKSIITYAGIGIILATLVSAIFVFVGGYLLPLLIG